MVYTNIPLMMTVLISTIVFTFIVKERNNKNELIRYGFIILIAIVCYFFNDHNYFIPFIISICLNVAAGRAIIKIQNTRTDLRKLLFISAITIDVFLLIFFKASIKLVSLAGFEPILLPLGLSFLTFREISYLIDIYTHKAKPFQHPLGDIAYIMLFTQIQSGPIMKYHEFTDPDIKQEQHNFTDRLDNINDGTQRIMTGFIKKIIMADSLAVFADQAFNEPVRMISLPMAWFGAICFSLQLYYDFSGYSDMAIGFTRLLGYKCNENFDYPYASSSISEFWRRWHISLGSWFKEYIYIPLGGSKKSQLTTFFNLFIVWILTGLWHGIDLTFIAWGLLHFTFAVIEHFTGIHRSEDHKVKTLWHIFVLFGIIIAWVMFRADSFSHGLWYIRSMVIPNITDSVSGRPNRFIPGLITSITALIFALPITKKLESFMHKRGLDKIYIILYNALIIILFAVSLALSANRANDTFAYANF
ncbi:MAG: MBOAT family protein [Oscillospiraceae bacterium]|nr:MBOAT family protein [Oscillospiraceae bacterium]